MAANDALGAQWHPNVNARRSGGIGHVEGDETRSVVGFLPTHVVARFREHDAGDDWNGEHSHRRVAQIEGDIRSGVGIKEPLQIDYDERAGWGKLGEGNHRLRAAERAGAPVVPVTIVGRANLARTQQRGVGAPLEHHTTFADHDPSYIPARHPPVASVQGGVMANPVALLRNIRDGDARYEAIVLWCPGCQYERADEPGKFAGGLHMLPVADVTTGEPRATWGWNRDLVNVTLEPSILTHMDRGEKFVCHSFLRNGQWQFLGDCTHALANQTVAMLPLSDWVVGDAGS